MNAHRRVLESTLHRAMSTFPAVLVTGARQVGKTTLLKRALAATHQYFTLDRPEVRRRAEHDPTHFIAESDGSRIIDEVQHAPQILESIKSAIDAEKIPGRFILSGSQSFPLMKGVAETLAGRVAVLTLDPLDFSESLDHARTDSIDERLDALFDADPTRSRVGAAVVTDAFDWILRGGYPEIRLNASVDRQLWFSSYVATYVDRDVRDLMQIGDLTTFHRFVALMASRTGQILNMSDVATDLGISVPTVKRWISVLETSQIIYLLPPYHTNLGKRIRKAPKLYFLDAGLAAFLSGLHTSASIAEGPSAGALFETAVVAEWVKLFRARGEQPSLFYFRSSAGLEVDLIIERNARLYAIEIKSSTAPKPGHATSLLKWLELVPSSTRAAIACRVPEARPFHPRIGLLPWSCNA